jgi:PadR family transcriptional regulator PadR
MRSMSGSTPGPRTSARRSGALPNHRPSGARSLIVTARPPRRTRKPFLTFGPVTRVDTFSRVERYSCRMSTRKEEQVRVALLQGTLDLLILRTLVFGPQHGQGIARAIQQQSEDTFLVDHSSLYPALQRLEARGWIRANWGTSENNRRARFYALTTAGRKQLVVETRQWRRVAFAIGRILGPEEA